MVHFPSWALTDHLHRFGSPVQKVHIWIQPLSLCLIYDELICLIVERLVYKSSCRNKTSLFNTKQFPQSTVASGTLSVCHTVYNWPVIQGWKEKYNSKPNETRHKSTRAVLGGGSGWVSSKVSLDALWEEYVSRCLNKIRFCTRTIYMEGNLYNQRVYFCYCDNTNFSPSGSTVRGWWRMWWVVRGGQ